MVPRPKGASPASRWIEESTITTNAAFLGVLLGIVAVDSISALVLFRLHRIYRLPYLLFWSGSWFAHAIYQSAAAVTIYLSTGSVASEPLRLLVSATGFAFGYTHIVALYLGIEAALNRPEVSRRRQRFMLLAAFAAGIALVLLSGAFSRETRFLVRLGPLTFLGAWVLFHGARGIARALGREPSVGRRLVALVFVAFATIRSVHFVFLVLRYSGLDLPATSLTATFMLSVMDLVLQAGMGFGMVIWFLDIERDKVIETEGRLRRAQRLEAVGLLAGGIAHDFNNSLTVILGYLELIREKLAKGVPVSHDVEEVAGAARRGASLTQQLLSFSRKQTLQTEAVELTEVVSGLAPMLNRLMPENVELRFELGSELAYVETDSSQLEQVILNLLLNARDAMPEGGRIVVATRNATARPGEKEKRVEGRFAVLSVTDTGAGMSEETAGRIFDPFFTTKPFGEGTGLGLSIVYGFAMQSGGSIDIDSKPGSGTRVELYLPLKGAPPEREKASSDTFAGGSETILVVEDDDGVRELVRQVLLSKGYDVMVSSDGQEALELAKAFTGRIDLLITDVLMPRRGGRELAERLRAQRPELAVLFMSGHTGGERVSVEQTGGRADFIQKPFSPQSLSGVVRRLLDAPREKPKPAS